MNLAEINFFLNCGVLTFYGSNQFWEFLQPINEAKSDGKLLQLLQLSKRFANIDTILYFFASTSLTS